MRKIVYYVATSIDGYISGLNNDVSNFIYTGNGVNKYLNDLKSYDTVIMGRATYEFGYKFGVIPGEPSPTYSHMKHYIFSDNLELKKLNSQVEIKKLDLKEIDKLKNSEGTDIYLCGGGQFAGWLLENQKIDVLKLKINPLILGDGVRLFGQSNTKHKLQLIDNSIYENGLQIITYNIVYSK